MTNMSLVADVTCAACRAGRVTQCSGRALFGYSGVYPRLDGAQAELVRVPHADTVLSPLPEAVSDEAAVFLADNLPTAYDAVVRGEVTRDDLVCVVGLGAVGLMAVMVALDIGATVFAVDGVADRRQLAAALGAQAFEPEEVSAAIAASTEGLGADVVVEAAGTPARSARRFSSRAAAASSLSSAPTSSPTIRWTTGSCSRGSSRCASPSATRSPTGRG